ncbi:nuclear transport factor 2 family protein [Sphingosinicella terrae]|uniref:nuclear transport factor 2 family protein n=1 Tax=Sphingosinicella terrae TaxID=2172047 RepID=UPI000E0D5104|nr:nuclear transport factor 2 family protein [Sphingosinicella terrae]
MRKSPPGTETERLEALERRLRKLEDIEAIRQLKSHYWTSLDRRQLEAVRACFADDASIDMEGVPKVDGPEAFIDFVRRAGAAPGAFNMHSGQNPRITLTGENEAEGLWDQFFLSVMAPPSWQWGFAERLTIQLTGEYRDRYVRGAQGWLIREMRFRQTSFLMSRVGEDGIARVLSSGRSDGSAFGD